MRSSSQIITTNKPTSNVQQAGCPSCHPTNSVRALKGKPRLFLKNTASKPLSDGCSWCRQLRNISNNVIGHTRLIVCRSCGPSQHSRQMADWPHATWTSPDCQTVLSPLTSHGSAGTWSPTREYDNRSINHTARKHQRQPTLLQDSLNYYYFFTINEHFDTLCWETGKAIRPVKNLPLAIHEGSCLRYIWGTRPNLEWYLEN